MTNTYAYINNNGISPLYTETFKVDGRNLICTTRKHEVAQRLEVANVFYGQNFPLTTCLQWAQSGDFKFIAPFITTHISENKAAIAERDTYADILDKAGYTTDSIMDWVMFGDVKLLEKN